MNYAPDQPEPDPGPPLVPLPINSISRAAKLPLPRSRRGYPAVLDMMMAEAYQVTGWSGERDLAHPVMDTALELTGYRTFVPICTRFSRVPAQG